MTGRWAVVKPTLSPKLGVGWVDLCWAGPNDRWGLSTGFTGVVEDIATFPSEEAALDALRTTFGPDWADHRRLKGARTIMIGDVRE